MKAELAENLLKKVMGWDTGEFIERVRDLQALAAVKYDEYGNYSAGSKFVENLAGWLLQFPDDDARRTALEFVLRDMMFISEIELGHLIGLVYPEIIEPVLRERVAGAHGLPEHAIATVHAHPTFAALQRRSLFIGASDGARLDRLRRSCPVLSHEQFLPGATPEPAVVEARTKKIPEHVAETAGRTFGHVFLVDDFSGSGRTLLRRDEDEPLDGKVVRVRDALAQCVTKGLVDENHEVTVVLYCAAEQAVDQVTGLLASEGIGNWEVRRIQTVPYAARVDGGMARLCHDLFDQTTEDADKGATPVGYNDCALPLVLSHNCPNNSICLLWMRGKEKPLRPLFPRYERHHPDRP